MLGAVMVFWPEAWEREEEREVWGCLAPVKSIEALKFAAKWRGLQPSDLAGEPRALFDRKPTKPPHKPQGLAQ
jgi:hypothetical protein